jgi:hypothetical protein
VEQTAVVGELGVEFGAEVAARPEFLERLGGEIRSELGILDDVDATTGLFQG